MAEDSVPNSVDLVRDLLDKVILDSSSDERPNFSTTTTTPKPGGRGGPNPTRKPHWKQGPRAQGRQHQSGAERRQQRPPREKKDAVSAEKLHQESIEAKRAPAKIFDCLSENRFQLAGWIKDNMPSEIKRSEGVGAVVVLAKGHTKEAFVTFEEKLSRGEKAHADWLTMVEAATPEDPLTFEAIGKLAEKQDLKGGKWMFHVDRKFVDSLWRQLAWAVGFDKFPKDVVSASVTPVDDLGHETAQDKGIHVVSLWNTDFRDEETILKVEKVVRGLNIKIDMIYKPDIYSGIGIYRNNPWKLRPVIYSSRKRNLSASVIDSGLDLKWRFPMVKPEQNSDIKPEVKSDPKKEVDESENKN